MFGEGGPVAVTLRVSEVWKGDVGKTLRVTTSADSGAGCGYPFEEGKEYLVYAGEDASVSLCSETKPLSSAGADLEALGTGERPKNGGTLPDTSGGLSVPALIWLAVLMAAVSFAIASQLRQS